MSNKSIKKNNLKENTESEKHIEVMNATTSYNLNVRADKSIDSKILRVIEPGSSFVLEKIEDDWGKLENENAWVMLKYVSF